MNRPDSDQLVMARDDLDGIWESAVRKQFELSDASPIELVLQCAIHPDVGSKVHYEDGLVLVTCASCGARSAQIEVADRARRWGREFRD